MFSSTEMPRENTVFQREESVAFGRKSFTRAVLTIFAIAFAGFVIGWLAFGRADAPATREEAADAQTLLPGAMPPQPAAQVAAPQVAPAQAPIVPSSGAGAQGPMSIPPAPQVSQQDDSMLGALLQKLTSFNPLSSGGGDQGILAPQKDINTMVNLELQKNHIDMIAPGLDHSLNDILDSEVIGQDGIKAGNVHDILVNRSTGMAQAIIMREDESLYGQDLAAFQFNRVQKQQENGNVYLTVPGDTAQGAFTYANIKNTDYISLRTLIDGQLLDYEGSVVGRIRDITYENAAAQLVYFQLAEHMVPAGKADLFSFPFNRLTVINSPDGYDIQMTRAQTQVLADYLYRPLETQAKP